MTFKCSFLRIFVWFSRQNESRGCDGSLRRLHPLIYLRDRVQVCRWTCLRQTEGSSFGSFVWTLFPGAAGWWFDRKWGALLHVLTPLKLDEGVSEARMR